MNTTTLQQDAIEAIQTADFRDMWPIKVRQSLVRAAKTEGEFPPYAVSETVWALRTARSIESRMNRGIDAGVATLSQAQKRNLLVVAR